MEHNIDTIISDLKAINEKLNTYLDKIEPVLAKDKYQIEDIDYLKSVKFQVVNIESFNKILWPLLHTDDDGALLKKSIIHNLLYSSLLQTKKRFDAIFDNDYQFDFDKSNDYKTRFFELGYCVEFIDNFIDDLQKQRLWFILLFAYFTDNKGLFDFNELVKTANNETDLEKRKKLYLDEYNRVNLLWLKNNKLFKCNNIDSYQETDDITPYNEDTDEDYQETKRYYYDFLENCQKAIESINFQLENSLSLFLKNNLSENSGKQNKSDVIKSYLFDNGFFQLQKVKALTHDSQSKLLDLCILNDIPYTIALFDFLGFFKYLENEMMFTKTAIHKKISGLFECSVFTIKGNMLALNEHSEIDKKRYTSHKHKEKVKTDYNLLK